MDANEPHKPALRLRRIAAHVLIVKTFFTAVSGDPEPAEPKDSGCARGPLAASRYPSQRTRTMALKSSAVDKERLQIDLSPSQMDTLGQMMKDCGLSTKKDLFNNAMTLLEWAIEQVKGGNVIASLNTKDDHYIELHMPVLSHAAQWARNDLRERRPLESADKR